MNVFTNIWKAYKRMIFHHCTDEFVADTSLSYWQNRLFAYSVVYLIPLSLLALIPGIYMAYISNLTGMIIVDCIAVLVVICVAFVPGISVFMRKLLFNGILYVTSAMLLLYLGMAGPGLLYLLGITIFIVLCLDKKYGYIAVGFNTLICISVGLFLYMGFGHFAILGEQGLGAWIAVSSNLVFLSAMSAILIPILFSGLQSAINEENKLRSELEMEQGKLHRTIEELNSKNQELEQFAYTASHDLKEPLRMVRNFLGLLELKYGPKLDEKAKKYIHFAVDGAERMTNSIDELLEYSRIGRFYKNESSIDMEELAQQVIKILSGEIIQKNAAVTIGELPVINGVPISIKTLVQNLISNALKYQPKGQQPIIKLDVRELESHWEFTIKDNGIGMEQEHFDEVFGMFKRLHSRSEYPGNGMGLALCKKIVGQHGGEIWVESEPGQGSTFYFTIEKNPNKSAT